METRWKGTALTFRVFEKEHVRMNLYQNDFRWKYFANTERATIVAKQPTFI